MSETTKLEDHRRTVNLEFFLDALFTISFDLQESIDLSF